MRQQVHHVDGHDFYDDRFARLLEVTTAPRGLPFKQSQVGIRQPGFFRVSMGLEKSTVPVFQKANWSAGADLFISIIIKAKKRRQFGFSYVKA